LADRLALLDLSRAEMAALLATWDQPRYRADQLWRWLYQGLADDAAAMTNLPAALRTRLQSDADLTLICPISEQASADAHTRKMLFRLRDDATIESVLMRYRQRQTACISTQAGCGMGCIFCATGQGGLDRNLSAGEILAQVIQLARRARHSVIERAGDEKLGPFGGVHPITHVVLMGMGEPLANYEATWQAIETLTDPDGLNLSARRITLSTVGLPAGIRRLAQEAIPVNLAVSLHAAQDSLRDLLVPVNRRYPLSELIAAVATYVAATRRRVSFEYALISGVNDAPDQARHLAALLAGMLCHVNLIPLNATPGSTLQPSPRDRVDAFRRHLEAAGIPVTVRMRRGADIEAGCGQLRRSHTLGARAGDNPPAGAPIGAG
jgi:23S rRNA (adenine2503-C2)-methyltransferase